VRSALTRVAETPTIVVETGGLPELLAQLGVGLLGVAGGLLVFFLSQRTAEKQRREDDSIRAAGELLLAMAEYTRLAAEKVHPPPGTNKHFVRFMTTTREPDGYALLRAAAAINAPRLTDSAARGAMKDLLGHLAVRGWRAPDPPKEWTAEERERAHGDAAAARDAAWARAEELLTTYLENET
jgi:hypothetical protein